MTRLVARLGTFCGAAIFLFVLPVLTPWWRRIRGTAVPSPRSV